MTLSVEDIIKRSKEAWSLKGQWQGLYDDAYEMSMPQRNTMTSTSAGSKKGATLYDSTLQQATSKLASTLQSTITPPFVEWANLNPGAFVTQNKEEIERKLLHITKAVFAAIKASNFDTVIGEYFMDLIVGTAAMLVLEGNDQIPLQFISVAISELAIEEGPDSQIGAVYRKYEKPVRTIPQMWPDMKPDHEIDKLIQEDGGKKITIQEVTYKDPEKNKWVYTVLLEKSGAANTSLPIRIVERIYDTNPWIIARWMKIPGEVFGRGPVLNVLADAKTLNTAKKLELQSAALAVSGVWLAKNNGILNTNAIKIQPGAVIPVQSTGGPMGADLQLLQGGGDINYSQIVQNDLRQSIKDGMYDRAIPDQGGVRSATEWVVRQQELQEAIGAPFGRMHQELIRPLFNRILGILYKKGIVEEIVVNGGTVEVQITGTLAQAQNMKEVETLTNWAMTVQQIAGPEVFQATAKVELVAKYMAEQLGINPELVRSEAEQQELMQKAQQAQQAQQGQVQQQGM